MKPEPKYDKAGMYYKGVAGRFIDLWDDYRGRFLMLECGGCYKHFRSIFGWRRHVGQMHQIAKGQS